MNLWSYLFSKNTNEKLSRFLTSLHRAEILTIFRSYFGRNDDFINSFWNGLTFKYYLNLLYVRKCATKVWICYSRDLSSYRLAIRASHSCVFHASMTKSGPSDIAISPRCTVESNDTVIRNQESHSEIVPFRDFAKKQSS